MALYHIAGVGGNLCALEQCWGDTGSLAIAARKSNGGVDLLGVRHYFTGAAVVLLLSIHDTMLHSYETIRRGWHGY